MRKKSKRSLVEGEFQFEIDPEPLEECVTSLGGLPLFLRAVRSLDVPDRVKRHLRLKRRERGLDEAAYVESFLTLNVVGGDCLEDFDQLREAPDVTQMAGYRMPSVEATRKFLYRFHDEGLIEQAQRELGLGAVSYVPEETAENRYGEALRTIALRVRRRQGELFGDGEAGKDFAGRTNLWDWKPKRPALPELREAQPKRLRF